MIQIRNHRLWGMFRATLLTMTLISLSVASSQLHAASLQPSITALGLTEIRGDRAAPAFRLPDLEGRMVSLEDYRGKVVMLYFWTTW